MLVNFAEVIANVIVGNLSIVSINLSLMINPVGFYQVTLSSFNTVTVYIFLSPIPSTCLKLTKHEQVTPRKEFYSFVNMLQIAKVMNIPFVFLVECLWLGRSLTLPTLASVIVVILGVITVTVSEFDVSVTAIGCAIAAVAVVSNGLQQIMCRLILKKNNLSASALLLIVGLPQVWIFRCVHLWFMCGFLNSESTHLNK